MNELGIPCKAWAQQGEKYCNKHLLQLERAEAETLDAEEGPTTIPKQEEKPKAAPTRKKKASGRQPPKAPNIFADGRGMHRSGKFKGGRYSEALPRAIASQYEKARQDPEILGLRDEIALLQARLHELQEGLQRNESGAAWTLAYEYFKGFQDATKAGDQESMADNLNNLGRVLRLGVDKHQSWVEIRQTILLIKQVGESERRRLLEMQQYISAERAFTLVTALVAEIHIHIKDAKLLEKISQGISNLVNQQRQTFMRYTDELEYLKAEQEQAEATFNSSALATVEEDEA